MSHATRAEDARAATSRLRYTTVMRAPPADGADVYTARARKPLPDFLPLASILHRTPDPAEGTTPGLGVYPGFGSAKRSPSVNFAIVERREVEDLARNVLMDVH